MELDLIRNTPPIARLAPGVRSPVLSVYGLGRRRSWWERVVRFFQGGRA